MIRTQVITKEPEGRGGVYSVFWHLAAPPVTSHNIRRVTRDLARTVGVEPLPVVLTSVLVTIYCGTTPGDGLVLPETLDVDSAPRWMTEKPRLGISAANVEVFLWICFYSLTELRVSDHTILQCCENVDKKNDQKDHAVSSQLIPIVLAFFISFNAYQDSESNCDINTARMNYFNFYFNKKDYSFFLRRARTRVYINDLKS